MPWDGGGTFTLLYDFSADRDAGAPDHYIQADKMDAELANIVAGLQNCMTLTGETTPTADIPMGGYTLTGVAAAAAADEPVIGSQVAGGLLGFAGTFGGTADALTATITFAPTSYSTGLQVRGVAASDNTSTTPTLKLNALAVKTITRGDGTALKAGDIKSGREYTFTYDGTNFRMQSPLVHSDRGWPVFVLSSVSSTSNAYAATVTSAQEWRALAAGQNFIFPCSDTNTGAATLAINGGSAYPIRQGDGTALAAGEIVAGNYYIAHFEGTYFRLIRTPGDGAVDGNNIDFSALTAALAFTRTGADTSVSATAASGYDSYIGVRRDAGKVGYFGYYTGSELRWTMYVDTAAESGSNAGSDWQMFAYDDDGVALGQVAGVTRATQVWDFQQTPTVGDGASTIWHSGNDGSGSGLDADTVDGVERSALYTAWAYGRIEISAGTPTLVRNRGITSVTDNGVGLYTFNLSSAASGDQAAVATVEDAGAVGMAASTGQSTSGVQISTTDGGSPTDFDALNFVAMDYS